MINGIIIPCLLARFETAQRLIAEYFEGLNLGGRQGRWTWTVPSCPVENNRISMLDRHLDPRSVYRRKSKPEENPTFHVKYHGYLKSLRWDNGSSFNNKRSTNGLHFLRK